MPLRLFSTLLALALTIGPAIPMSACYSPIRGADVDREQLRSSSAASLSPARHRRGKPLQIRSSQPVVTTPRPVLMPVSSCDPGQKMALSVYRSLRRNAPIEPSAPEPNSRIVPGSGTLPLPVLPRIVNDSEGMVPTLLSDA